ncbi:MAG: putative family transporter [Actinomycetia bacterium]|nr:putative family transporter [Actinomycetes bacterium]
MSARTTPQTLPPPQPSGAIETRSIDYVPEAERHGKVWQQGPFWFLGNFQPFTVAIGLIGPGLGLSLVWSIAAGVLGILFGTFFMAFHASQGPWLGLPQMIQSRAQFGYRGVVVALAGTLFTFLGFNVVDTVIIDGGMKGIFGWNATVVGLVITVIAALLAIYGHDWLHRAFRVLFWLSLPLWIVLTIAVVSGHAGGKPATHGGFTLVVFMIQFTAAASYNITYAPYVSDYSRYLPRRTSTLRIVASVFWGASGSAIWLIALGAWMASRLGSTDPLIGIRDAGDHVLSGFGGVLAVLTVLALVATMGLNAYSAMLTVLTGVASVRDFHPTRRARIITIVVLAAVWAVIGIWMITNMSAALNNALLIMLYLLAPWTAVNLIDYFFVRRGHYAVTHLFRPDGIYGAWAWRGLVAYFAGLLSSVPFAVLSFYTGSAAKALSGVDISFAVSMVVAGGVYWMLTRSLDVTAEEPAVAESEQALAAGSAA